MPDFFLHVPDHGPKREPSGDPGPPWNLPSDLAGFVARFPQWCERGVPKSWEHFVTGLRRMNHEEGRAFLTASRAAKMGQVEGKDFDRAMKHQERILGLR